MSMYRSRDGRWTVEHVTGTWPDGHTGDVLRVRHRGYPVALCSSVAELAELLNLADLELIEDADRHHVPAA